MKSPETVEEAYEQAIAEANQKHLQRMALLQVLANPAGCSLLEVCEALEGLRALDRTVERHEHYLGWLTELMNEQHKIH